MNAFYIDYLAAMGEPGGGRNEVDPRFISMFSVYNVTFPTSETLNYIYTSILSGHLQTFSEAIQSIANGLVKLMLELYEVILRHVIYSVISSNWINNIILFRQSGRSYCRHRLNSIIFSTCGISQESRLDCCRAILISSQA